MIQQLHFWVYTQKSIKAGYQRDICTQSSSIMHSSQKQSKRPLTDD